MLADAELDSGVSGGRIGFDPRAAQPTSRACSLRQREIEQTRAALGHDCMTA